MKNTAKHREAGDPYKIRPYALVGTIATRWTSTGIYHSWRILLFERDARNEEGSPHVIFSLPRTNEVAPEAGVTRTSSIEVGGHLFVPTYIHPDGGVVHINACSTKHHWVLDTDFRIPNQSDVTEASDLMQRWVVEGVMPSSQLVARIRAGDSQALFEPLKTDDSAKKV
jgi:hypothetical protein